MASVGATIERMVPSVEDDALLDEVAETEAQIAYWQARVRSPHRGGRFGVVYESPTMAMVPIDVPPGRYRVLITGKGIIGRGWPGSGTPGDARRIRAWPSDEVIEPKRLKAFDEDQRKEDP